MNEAQRLVTLRTWQLDGTYTETQVDAPVDEYDFITVWNTGPGAGGAWLRSELPWCNNSKAQ